MCDVRSAPYRSITVRDILSDLPPIKNGANKENISYGEARASHYQNMVSILYELLSYVCGECTCQH